MAKPNCTANLIASLFKTGKTPGKAKSIAHACVFGSAPKAVDAPENIFVLVASCTCTSKPITVSQVIMKSRVIISCPYHKGFLNANLCLIEIDALHSAMLFHQNACQLIAILSANYY